MPDELKRIGSYWPTISIIVLLVAIGALFTKVQFQTCSNADSIERLQSQYEGQLNVVNALGVSNATISVRLASMEKTLERIDKSIDGLQQNQKEMLVQLSRRNP